MGQPDYQQVQQYVYPVQQVAEKDIFQQAITWLGHNVPGGFTTIFFSTLLGLPICLGFIFKKKVMFWLKPLAEYILKRG